MLPTPGRGLRGAGPLLPALLAVACDSGGGGPTIVAGADYTLLLHPVVANNQSPFDALDKLDLVLQPEVGDARRVSLGTPGSGETADVGDLGPLADTTIVVEGYRDGELAAWGRTEPLTAETGELETNVLVAETESVAWLGSLPEALWLPFVANVGDGAFLLGGGLANDRNGDATKSHDVLYRLDLAPPDAPPAFVAVGTLPAYQSGGNQSQTARMGATFTPLAQGGADQGKLLLAGGSEEHPYTGSGSPTVSKAASLYDPETGTFEDLASGLAEARTMHGALENVQGNVVFWGGWGYVNDTTRITWAATIEVYDRGSRAFVTAGTPNDLGAMDAAGADLGTDGTLVCGGAELLTTGWISRSGCVRVSLDGSSADADADLPVALAGHAMIDLPDGRVLVTGGGTSATESPARETVVNARAEAWIYAPDTRAWSAARSMSLPRAGHRMAALPDGRVLIVGGAASYNPLTPPDDPLSCVEIFDPSTTSFTTLEGCTAADDTGGLAGRAFQPAVAVDPERGVLAVGGLGDAGDAQSAAGLFVPRP